MNIPETPKLVGHCSCCDGPCYEQIATFPEGHALAGRPRNVGTIKSETKRMEFLLSDSTTMTMTFCGKCAEELTVEDYPALMAREVISWAHEIMDDHRAALGAERWADERKEDYLRRMSGLMIMAKWCDRPLEAG